MGVQIFGRRFGGKCDPETQVGASGKGQVSQGCLIVLAGNVLFTDQPKT
jgi:hypothetical protein